MRVPYQLVPILKAQKVVADEVEAIVVSKDIYTVAGFSVAPVSAWDGAAAESVSQVMLLAQGEPGYSHVSFPVVDGKSDALRWVHDSDWFTWVITHMDSSVGIVGLHRHDGTIGEPVDGVTPVIYWDVEEYLLPAWRGIGLASSSWELVEETFLPGGVHVVAEARESNMPAIRRYEKARWEYAGQVLTDSRPSVLARRYIHIVGSGG